MFLSVTVRLRSIELEKPAPSPEAARVDSGYGAIRFAICIHNRATAAVMSIQSSKLFRTLKKDSFSALRLSARGLREKAGVTAKRCIHQSTEQFPSCD
jgi:capsid protein